MNYTLSKRLCLTAMLTLAAVVYTTSAFAETSKLVIESGDSAQSRQEAAMEKGTMERHPQSASESEYPRRKRVGQSRCRL
ncbi:putative secreted protein [Salmonella enterica subsp. arizonae]|uniref:Putative secreted protein n=1 Tax=Salmonella enterica subsp. arizonae TaxID=59203 RepID=A0A2X4TC86_SALER|nr:putative secreted protein [Salmonella enterica subsp. arizonae]